MLRGELSNLCLPRYGVDYRVVLRRAEQSALGRLVDTSLRASGFYGYSYSRYTWKEAAINWLQRNMDYSAIGIIIGEEACQDMIEDILLEHIPEVIRFSTRYEFRHWVAIADRLFRVYTVDSALVGLDTKIVQHNEWGEIFNGF